MSFAMFGSGGAVAASAGAGDEPPAKAGEATAVTNSAQLELASLLPDGWAENGGPFTRTLGTLLSNPYFSAGAGLWVLTVAGMLGRQALTLAETLLRRRFVVSMELVSTDQSFDWMMRWIASQPRLKVQQVTVLSRYTQIFSNDSTDSECIYGPCPNVRHMFYYQGRPMTLSRRRTERSYDGDVFETMQFTTLGLSSSIFEKMMEDAQKFSAAQDNNRTVVYVNAGGRWSRQQRPRDRRPFNSVIMPGNVGSELLADVTRFLQSDRYYRELGVPYRRGYLLHGPPGCGKTSFVMALAGELRLSICLLSLSNRGLTDDALMSLLNSAEMRSIVLLEDIDRAFSNDSNITMSGLLNALDGVGAQEGRLVFMTTNHVEVLDSALIRPGRADVKVEIGLLDQEQAAQMFARFFPKTPKEMHTAFAAKVPQNKVSAAQIQSHLFFHRDEPQRAIDQFDAFIRLSDDFETKVHKKQQMEQRVRDLPRTRIIGKD